MGMLGAFVFGYILGAKAGPESLVEIRKAWTTISQSEEVKGAIAIGMSMAGGMAAQFTKRMSDGEQPDGRPGDPGIISLAVVRQIRERLA